MNRCYRGGVLTSHYLLNVRASHLISSNRLNVFQLKFDRHASASLKEATANNQYRFVKRESQGSSGGGGGGGDGGGGGNRKNLSKAAAAAVAKSRNLPTPPLSKRSDATHKNVSKRYENIIRNYIDKNENTNLASETSDNKSSRSNNSNSNSSKDKSEKNYFKPVEVELNKVETVQDVGSEMVGNLDKSKMINI
jgi:hypothetical protein